MAAYSIAIEYTRGPALHPYVDHDLGPFEELEIAAQTFQSEAGVSWHLAEIVEELSLEGKVEYEEDDHPWRRITACELAEAVV